MPIHCLARLKGDHLVTLLDQLVKINLLCPLMVSFLHAVEVKKFTSGLQHSFGEREEFGLIPNGVFFR